ncbi:MAG TPA: NrfD/PsrC family molybdoenzyme membrane anchor subunit, partial [Acetobacteraceae bacterium]|nr:NrfD/PsrC family molybdoenzyme membrane anchor subunit [Acetobacteraceae bacterium]
MNEQSAWDGRTYYGEPQLRAAPFNKALVGSYIFLAGLSGAAQLLAAMMDFACGPGAAPTVRRGRYLAMLAPTLGTACLILDLHTPRRFYNM